MLPTIGSNYRPNTPSTWERTPTTKADLAWHHIVPYRQLRALWNALVTQPRENQLAEIRTAIRQYLLLCDRNVGDIDQWIDRIRDGSLEVVECNMLTTKAAWPAWNIVEGPSLRSDDPGDYYIDRYTHGVTWQESERMGSIELLHRKLSATQLTSQATAAELAPLIDAFSFARQSLRGDKPIPFRESMWTQDGAGLWSKQRTGERFIPG